MQVRSKVVQGSQAVDKSGGGLKLPDESVPRQRTEASCCSTPPRQHTIVDNLPDRNACGSADNNTGRKHSVSFSHGNPRVAVSCRFCTQHSCEKGSSGNAHALISPNGLIQSAYISFHSDGFVPGTLSVLIGSLPVTSGSQRSPDSSPGSA